MNLEEYNKARTYLIIKYGSIEFAIDAWIGQEPDEDEILEDYMLAAVDDSKQVAPSRSWK